MPWMAVTGASFIFPSPGQFLHLLLLTMLLLSEAGRRKDD